MKTNLLYLILFACLFHNLATGQEITSLTDTYLKDGIPAHLYLWKSDSSPIDQSDYISRESKNNLIISGGSTRLELNRFYQNSAIAFDQHTTKVQLPCTVIGESIEKNKKISIGFWFNVNNIYKNYVIGYLGQENKDSVKFEIQLKNKKIRIKKRLFLDNKYVMPVIFETDFPLDYEGYVPTYNDIMNGFIYLCISSDMNSCRISVSRPGGRLYQRWIFTSLIDNVSSKDAFCFGRPVYDKTSDVIHSLDNIMIYNDYQTPEQTFNNYCLQSPLIPGLSYLIQNPHDLVLSPEKYNNKSDTYQENYIIWRKRNSPHTGAFSSDKWMAKYLSTTTSTGNNIVSISNSRSGAYIYNQTSSNYYYQLLYPAQDYPLRAGFKIEHSVNSEPTNLYKIDPGTPILEPSGHMRFELRHSPGFYIGSEGEYAYSDYPAGTDTNWRIIGVQKVCKGPQRQINTTLSKGLFVMFKNIGTGKYLDRITGPQYVYAALGDRKISSKNQRFYVYPASKSDCNIYIKYIITNMEGDFLSSYWGKQDQKENEYLIYYPQVFFFEFMYVKDDANNKPLYAIRASNDYGTYLIGARSDSYVYQASADVYTETGDVDDNFLWSIDILSN